MFAGELPGKQPGRGRVGGGGHVAAVAQVVPEQGVELAHQSKPLSLAAREAKALDILGLTPGHDQPELPLQVTEIAQYNRQRQAEIDERRSMRIPAEEPEELDLGEAWNVLAERRRDAVIQSPKPPIPAADAVLKRSAEREVEA